MSGTFNPVSFNSHAFRKLGHVAIDGPSLIMTNDCICPGHQLSYECTTVGPVATVWQGSALSQCESSNILLRHSRFTSPQGATGTCNNGGVTGRSLGVEGDRYTSQLNITVSFNLNSQTVQCAHDDGQTLTTVGSDTIVITTGTKSFDYNVYLTVII